MKNNLPNQPVAAESLARKHEAQDPHLRTVGIAVVSVISLVILCFLATMALMFFLSQKRPLHNIETLGIIVAPDQKPLTRFPQPNLQLDDGHASFIAMNEQQRTKLNSYGWVDRSNNIVHIPIDQAMNLVLARGLTIQLDNLPQSNPPSRIPR